MTYSIAMNRQAGTSKQFAMTERTFEMFGLLMMN